MSGRPLLCSAQVSPLLGEVGTQFFARYCAVSCALDQRAMLSRNLLPLLHSLVTRHANSPGSGDNAAKNVNCLSECL